LLFSIITAVSFLVFCGCKKIIVGVEGIKLYSLYFCIMEF
jgi:hypothetical protein